MKTILLSFGVFLSTSIFGQSCHCTQDTLLKESISCKPTLFDNNAKLFWSFNCDSSWLTFQSPKKKRKIIYSLSGNLVSFTTRLGYMDWAEFNNAFLVTNHVISGCCDPVDYYLHNKTNGNLIKYLGTAVFVSENKNLPFVVSFGASKYNQYPNYNSLTIYNLDNYKEYKIVIPKGDIDKGMKNNDFMFPEYLFETPQLNKGILVLKYATEKIENNKQLNYRKIIIDFQKYRR